MKTPGYLRLCSRLFFPVALGCFAACGGSTPTVNPPPPPPSAPITVIAETPSSATLSFGTTRVLTAEAKNAAGQTVAATFVWHSSLASVATVDATGKVTAIAAGTANLTATSGGVTSNSVSITVTVIAGTPGSVVVDKASVLLSAIGQAGQLSANRLDECRWYWSVRCWSNQPRWYFG